jgi:ATP-dependent Clp protease ATP-binding subunit ClpC
MEILRSHFRPEFLNRLDEIIIFEALDEDQIRQIVELRLERVKRTARGQGVELVFDRRAVNYLAKIGYMPEFGARELRRQIRNEIENKLAKEILKSAIGEGSVVVIDHSPTKGIVFSHTRLKGEGNKTKTKSRV